MSESRPLPGAATDPRIQFAAERTLLAWVRTGLALMGFGFVVARFGLFLRQFGRGDRAAAATSSPSPLLIGVALAFLGVGVTLSAAVRHARAVPRLSRGEALQFKPVSLSPLGGGAPVGKADWSVRRRPRFGFRLTGLMGTTTPFGTATTPWGEGARGMRSGGGERI